MKKIKVKKILVFLILGLIYLFTLVEISYYLFQDHILRAIWVFLSVFITGLIIWGIQNE